MNQQPGVSALRWTKLREFTTREEVSGVASIRTGIDTGAGAVRLALGGMGEVRLLLPISPGGHFPDIVTGPGLSLRDCTYSVEGRNTRFIDLTCSDPELEKVFGEVADDILRRVEEGTGPGRAVENAIADFRSLLLHGRFPSIDPARAAGVLGELLFLNRILSRNSDAWVAWQGPQGGRHDFREGRFAVEVKATIRAQRQVIDISALDQLQEPEGGELFLVFFEFEQDAGGQLTVAMEAGRALSLASDPERLSVRLAAIGYDDAAADQWQAFRFSVKMEATYRITEGFPRLVPADIRNSEMPAGVSHFRYRVDLGIARQFRITKEEAEDLPEKLIA